MPITRTVRSERSTGVCQSVRMLSVCGSCVRGPRNKGENTEQQMSSVTSTDTESEWVSAMRRNKYNMCIILESGRNGSRRTQKHTHRRTEHWQAHINQSRWFPQWAALLIESISWANGNVEARPICPATLPCTVDSVVETLRTVSRTHLELYSKQVIKQAYSHFQPSYALSHVS